MRAELDGAATSEGLMPTSHASKIRLASGDLVFPRGDLEPTIALPSPSSLRRLTIKRLESCDGAEIEALVLALDAPSRLCRFGASVPDGWLVQYASRALRDSAFVAGAYLDDRLRGFTDVYETGDTAVVEAAFLVERGWRGRGLGTALLAAARQWSEGSGRSTLRMLIAKENWPMRKLAEKAGAVIDLVDAEIVADLALGDRPCLAARTERPHHAERRTEISAKYSYPPICARPRFG
jgi:GNAT superfamily N-acetyltransferase